jgi:glycosyltransferase involved in cell wall biosynthesis
MSEKVSVIVPIYKVEKYLPRCIDSILNQTYKNIEIILVNDGSPDRCGEIVEEYASIDNRIKVIHKKNGGLSDARNAGMDLVTGKYTIFVDSDDWLDIKMIAKLMNTCKKFKADVVQSAFYYAYENQLLLDHRYYKVKEPPIVFDREALMNELVKNERVKNFAWGKLIKTRILQGIQFKKGVLFEDVFWAHQVMHRTERYVLVNAPLYYYLQRDDSIVSTYTTRNLDILAGLKERHKFIEKHYKHLVDDSYKEIFKTSLIHYKLLMINWRKDKSGTCRKDIRSYIREHSTELKRAVKNDQLLKTQLTLFFLHPSLNLLLDLFKKIFRTLEIIPQPSGLKSVMLTDEKMNA